VQRGEGGDEAGGEIGGRDWGGIAVAVDYLEVVDKDWEKAMLVVMAEAEAIEPTFEEAKCQTDWPKWQDAIKVELAFLKIAGTCILSCAVSPRSMELITTKHWHL
jgi:hypothetical protein